MSEQFTRKHFNHLSIHFTLLLNIAIPIILINDSILLVKIIGIIKISIMTLIINRISKYTQKLAA